MRLMWILTCLLLLVSISTVCPSLVQNRFTVFVGVFAHVDFGPHAECDYGKGGAVVSEAVFSGGWHAFCSAEMVGETTVTDNLAQDMAKQDEEGTQQDFHVRAREAKRREKLERFANARTSKNPFYPNAKLGGTGSSQRRSRRK